MIVARYSVRNFVINDKIYNEFLKTLYSGENNFSEAKKKCYEFKITGKDAFNDIYKTIIYRVGKSEHDE